MNRRAVPLLAGVALALAGPSVASACPEHTPDEELLVRERALSGLVAAPVPAADGVFTGFPAAAADGLF